MRMISTPLIPFLILTINNSDNTINNSNLLSISTLKKSLRIHWRYRKWWTETQLTITKTSLHDSISSLSFSHSFSLHQSLSRVNWEWRRDSISETSFPSLHQDSNRHSWDDESEEGEEYSLHYCCHLWISRIHSRLLSIQHSSKLFILLRCCSWYLILWCQYFSYLSFTVLHPSSHSCCSLHSTTEWKASRLHQSRLIFILSHLSIQVLCHSISPQQQSQCALFWLWHHSIQESNSLSSILQNRIYCLSTGYNSLYWILLCQIKSSFNLSLQSSSHCHQHHKRRWSTLHDESVSPASSQTHSSSLWSLL